MVVINRQRQILTAFTNADTVHTSKELASMLEVSTRTVISDIHTINEEVGIELVKYDSRKRLYYIKNYERMIQAVKMVEVRSGVLNSSSDWPFLIYMILYRSAERVTISEIEERLHTSTSLINQCLKDLKLKCEKCHVTLNGNVKGIIIQGKDIWKDFVLATLTLPRINRRIKNQYLYVLFEKRIPFLKREMEEMLAYIYRKNGAMITGTDSYILLVFYLISIKENTDNVFKVENLSADRQTFVDEYIQKCRITNDIGLNRKYFKIKNLLLKRIGTKKEEILTIVLSNFQFHEMLDKQTYFKVKQINSMNNIENSGLSMPIFQIDSDLFNIIQQRIMQSNLTARSTEVIVLLENFPLAYSLADRIKEFSPFAIYVSVLSNVFMLDKLLNRSKRIVLISDQIRIQSRELTNNITFFDTGTLNTDWSIGSFVDEIIEEIRKTKKN